jgi:hypothetical protein
MNRFPHLVNVLHAADRVRTIKPLRVVFRAGAASGGKRGEPLAREVAACAPCPSEETGKQTARRHFGVWWRAFPMSWPHDTRADPARMDIAWVANRPVPSTNCNARRAAGHDD